MDPVPEMAIYKHSPYQDSYSHLEDSTAGSLIERGVSRAGEGRIEEGRYNKHHPQAGEMFHRDGLTLGLGWISFGLMIELLRRTSLATDI